MGTVLGTIETNLPSVTAGVIGTTTEIIAPVLGRIRLPDLLIVIPTATAYRNMILIAAGALARGQILGIVRGLTVEVVAVVDRRRAESWTRMRASSSELLRRIVRIMERSMSTSSESGKRTIGNMRSFRRVQ